MKNRKPMTSQEYRNMKANDPFKPVILSEPKSNTKSTKTRKK